MSDTVTVSKESANLCAATCVRESVQKAGRGTVMLLAIVKTSICMQLEVTES
jgi:hypothetical protein